VVPGAQTGIFWLRGTARTTTVRCDIYLDAVEARTQGWLYELKSPRGTPLGEVFQDELGIDAQEQARFLVYREMLRAAGPAVPAPSLTGQYAGLRALGVVGAGAASGLEEGIGGWLKGLFSSKGTRIAAATGAIRGSGAELQRTIHGLNWLVGLAVFLTWWGPYILGLVNLVLLGLFPFVMLWALIPGTQFQPLAHYFVALLFTNSMPLWWSLVDIAQRLAGQHAPQSRDVLTGLMSNWLVAFSWSTIVTVLGILLIPVVTAILMFSVFRAVGGLWRVTV